MAVIAPGTTIYLIEGCPLDDDYEHTIYWGPNEQDRQIRYFTQNVGTENGFTDDRVFHQFINNTYQRVEKGRMRVELQNASEANNTADILAKCNYVSFRNNPYNGKWYFGFVQSIEYINNRVAEITFTIDVLQTWYFDYEILPCFVDREHVYDDHRGRNTIEEGLEFGDYFFHEKPPISLGRTKEHDPTQLEYYIVVAGSVGISDTADLRNIQDTDIIDVYGGCYGGIYSGCAFNIFRYPETVNNFLAAVTNANKIDAIVGIFMVPTDFFAGELPKPADYNRLQNNWQPIITSGYDRGENNSYGNAGISGNLIDRYTLAVQSENVYVKPSVIEEEPEVSSAYTPRNKKLLAFPYSKVVVTNLNGDYAEYRYEYFAYDTYRFKRACVLSVEPEAGCWPTYYKGLEDNYIEKLIIKDFPLCSFSIDSFKAWYAQRKYEVIAGFGVDALHAFTGIGMMAATGGTAGSLLSGAAMAGGKIKGIGQVGGSVENAIMKGAQIADKATLPNRILGSTTNNFNMALGIQGFHVYNAQIRPFWAQKLDGFFDRYGYKVGRFKTVNRKNRKWYTYVKTINCEIEGKIPGEYYKEILSIYNRGVTFWVSPQMTGHYFGNIAGLNKTVVEDNEPLGGGWS